MNLGTTARARCRIGSNQGILLATQRNTSIKLGTTRTNMMAMVVDPPGRPVGRGCDDGAISSNVFCCCRGSCKSTRNKLGAVKWGKGVLIQQIKE